MGAAIAHSLWLRRRRRLQLRPLRPKRSRCRTSHPFFPELQRGILDRGAAAHCNAVLERNWGGEGEARHLEAYHAPPGRHRLSFRRLFDEYTQTQPGDSKVLEITPKVNWLESIRLCITIITVMLDKLQLHLGGVSTIAHATVRSAI